MKFFKRLLAPILAIVMLFSTTACAKVDKDPNTLTIGFAETGYGRLWLEETIKAFQVENPEVKFILEGDAGLTAKILPRLESGTELCDIFFGLQTNWQMYAYQDFLEPLDDLYATVIDNGKTYAEKIIPEALEYGKVNGHYYSGNWNDGVSGLIYNKGMFDAKGWAIPTTVDELFVLCDKIRADAVNSDQDRKNDIFPFAWGGQVAKYWDFFIGQLWAQYEGIEGIKTFNKFESPEVFHQEGRLKALEVFEKLMKEEGNSVPGAMSKNHIASQMDFIQGRAAMMPNGAWVEFEMRNSLKPDFQMRMMQTPVIDKEHNLKTNWTSSGDFYIIPKACPDANKQLAKKFLAFMARDEQLKAYTKNTGTPRAFVYDLDDIEGLSDFNKSVIDIYKNSKNIYMYSNSPLYYKNLCNMWPATGGPYGMIADGDSAKSVFDLDYNKAVTEWSSWLAQVQ